SPARSSTPASRRAERAERRRSRRAGGPAREDAAAAVHALPVGAALELTAPLPPARAAQGASRALLAAQAAAARARARELAARARGARELAAIGVVALDLTARGGRAARRDEI